MKIRATLDVVEISQSLGDVKFLWSFCGRDTLCPTCREKGNARGCQRYFQDKVIHTDVDKLFHLVMSNGVTILATDVELLEHD